LRRKALKGEAHEHGKLKEVFKALEWLTPLEG
jgi:hypothetical protein